jgi:GNAT superfamily N-acetyltransferase
VTNRIKIAETDEEVAGCFPLMAELRPHIITEEEFVSRVGRQNSLGGYQLIFLEDEEKVRAVAGVRIFECLAFGKLMRVDDLVTVARDRSKGYGQTLFDWLVEYAKENGCAELHLDSGVQRFRAHRFYLRNRMEINCHHFRLPLN